MKRVKPIWVLVALPLAFAVIMLAIGGLCEVWEPRVKPAVVGVWLLTGLAMALPLCLTIVWAESPKALPPDMQRVYGRYSHINWYVSLAMMFGLGLFLGACFTAKVLVVKLIACALLFPGACVKMALLSRLEHLSSLGRSRPPATPEADAPEGRA